MANNKQSSVEWYAEQDTLLTISFLKDKITEADWAIKKLRLFEQAKEMHKEEMIDAHIKGDNTYTVGGAFHIAAEQYYNEKYGKDNIDNTAV